MSGLFNLGTLKTIVFSISTPHNYILWLCSSFSDILTHTFLYEVSWLINTYIFYIIGIWMSKDSLVLCSMEYLNNMWPVFTKWTFFSGIFHTLFSHQSLFPIKPITFVSTNHVFLSPGVFYYFNSTINPVLYSLMSKRLKINSISVFPSLYLYIFLCWSLLVLLVASPYQTNLASLLLIYVVFFY